MGSNVNVRFGYDPDNDIIYAGMDDDGTVGPVIYKSTNQGSTWTLAKDIGATEGFVDGIRTMLYDPVTTRMYAATSGRAQIWYNIGGGATWTKLFDFLSTWTNTIDCPGLGIDYSRTPDRMWAATGNDGRVFYSDDNGTSWTESIRLETVSPYIQICGDLFVNPNTNYIYVPGSDRTGVMVSKDNGASWEIDKNDFADNYMGRIAYDTGNKIMVIGTFNNGDIYTRDD